MMKQYNGYSPNPAPLTTKPDLPEAGVYQAEIKGARAEDTPWGGQRLIIALDIIEGEYRGRYQEIFDWEKQNASYSPKWKGTLRMNVPTGDGSEKDGWTKRMFEGNIWAIETSNPGYKFDFDESKLKGKIVGINVRRKEWDYNDQTGWTTEIGRLESITEVREGKVKPMKDKPLPEKKEEAVAMADPSGFTPIETEELPF